MTGTYGFVILSGMLLTGGVWLVAWASQPGYPKLATALQHLSPGKAELLDGEQPATDAPRDLKAEGLIDRLIPVSPSVQRQLMLANHTRDWYRSLQIAGVLAGLALPSGIGLLLGLDLVVPMAVSALLALAGFLLPHVLLRLGNREAHTDAAEALLTFADVVVLERLANQSVTQALHSAAQLSDNPVFVRIRHSLERAKLEQLPPYVELQRVSTELQLPALKDIADILRLDESGAALAGVLQARIQELREAHRVEATVAAASVSERMTFLMVVPSLVFGLIFLVPPLLRMAGA